MGWFLRRNHAGGGQRRSGRGAAKRDQVGTGWSPARTLLGLKIVGVVAGIAALAAGWHLTHRTLGDYARTHHATPITAEDVVLESAPEWMPRGLELELRRLVAEQVGEDPVDNTTLRAAAGALRDWAWVAPEGVRQVTRLGDGRVSVEVAFRAPMAVIEARDGYHLISREGVRLPALYEREQIERMRVPVIVGGSNAPPRMGERWQGRDVAAGLALVRLLADEGLLDEVIDEVRAVDVSRRDARDRPRLALRTERGAVLWGLPPGEEQSVEPDASTKLERLRQVVSAHGSIDAGGQRVHLYGATVQVSRPEGGSQEAAASSLR